MLEYCAWKITYSRISTLIQDRLARGSRQGLGAGHDAIGAVDGAPSAGEGDEISVSHFVAWVYKAVWNRAE